MAEIPLGMGRGEAGRKQEGVALAQGNLQPLSQSQQHLPAGSCPSRLEKTDVPRRDLGIEGQRELA